MRKYTFKPSALYIMSVAMFLAAGIGSALAWRYLGSFRILMFVLIGLCVGAAVLFGLILLPMYFRRTVIYISQSEITVHTGLIFLKREHMKMSAVQYVTLISTPLGGVTGFNFVILRALGGSLVLPFLSVKDCEEILTVVQSEIAGE